MLNGENQTEEENRDKLLPNDLTKESKPMRVLWQTKDKEIRDAFRQQPQMSQELPSTSSPKIPPDKAVNKQGAQVSYDPPLTSLCGPTLSQTPPVLLCSEMAGQPNVKPHQSILESEGIAKNPIAIPDKAANQSWSSSNGKTPPCPDIQAEISSGPVLSEAEWNESAAKSSASVNILSHTLRDYAPDAEFPVIPAVLPSDEKPPSDDDQKAGPEVTNDDFTINDEPIPIPSSEQLLEAPALLTVEAIPLPPVNQPLCDGHNLQLGFLDGEPVDEFSPLFFLFICCWG